MAHEYEDTASFTGFGLGAFSQSAAQDGGVFILAVYRDGSLTAGAYATERAAMESAAELSEDERDEDEEHGTLEDRFTRAQRLVADEGGVLEIIPSPVYGL